MADLPEIKVVLINRPEVGKYGQGSEAANALAASAIAGAFLDATGKVARRTSVEVVLCQESAESLRTDYIIATGGAGSSGLPALPSGPRIMRNASAASTNNPIA